MCTWIYQWLETNEYLVPFIILALVCVHLKASSRLSWQSSRLCPSGLSGNFTGTPILACTYHAVKLLINTLWCTLLLQWPLKNRTIPLLAGVSSSKTAAFFLAACRLSEVPPLSALSCQWLLQQWRQITWQLLRGLFKEHGCQQSCLQQWRTIAKKRH